MNDTKTIIERLKYDADIMRQIGEAKGNGERISLVLVAGTIDEAVKKLEEQELTIDALMGKYGDSCDGGCGSDKNG